MNTIILAIVVVIVIASFMALSYFASMGEQLLIDETPQQRKVRKDKGQKRGTYAKRNNKV